MYVMPATCHIPYTTLGVTKQDNLRYFFSSNGWTTSALMIQYINNIIVPHTHDQPSLLILDCYEAHLTADVLHHAASHNIRVATIPASMTYTHQPLDVAIFPSVKSAWRHSWEKSMNNWYDERQHGQPPSSSLNHALELLSPILHRVRRHQIVRAFKDAWPSIFSVTEHQSSTATITLSNQQALTSTSALNSESTLSSFQPICGPFPYHWVDPLYKPNVNRLLLPPNIISEPPVMSTNPQPTSSPTTMATTSAPPPPVSIPVPFVCTRCQRTAVYTRFCRCTAINICLECLPFTWVCPICMCHTTVIKV